MQETQQVQAALLLTPVKMQVVMEVPVVITILAVTQVEMLIQVITCLDQAVMLPPVADVKTIRPEMQHPEILQEMHQKDQPVTLEIMFVITMTTIIINK